MKIKFQTTYTVNDRDQLVIEHYAEVTRPCPVNMTNHAFWNLDGKVPNQFAIPIEIP